ncbi:MAG: ferrous iron transport protein B [Clostridiales bacterium]|nr:ferrous iron transport protein B [Clostridiales bacterium]
MEVKIALAGNPNSGKTTLFNALTGSNQFVGNWPGVTVEKKEGRLRGRKNVTIVDLPGIYSLSPYTLEEVVARKFLIEGKPDAIINIIDGTNLERNLYLTTQLLELGIPVIAAVNLMDVVKKQGDKIDFQKLGKALGCEIVPISALKGTGINEAAEKAVKAAMTKKKVVPSPVFDKKTEEWIGEIAGKLGIDVPEEQKRFYAIKLFEGDDKINLKDAPDVSDIVKKAEAEEDDDTESIITNARYDYIASVIKGCYTKNKKHKLTTSDKIDRVVTNRFLALPIFAAVMFLIYFISITTVGTWATDWANDGLFGDGWHLFGIGTSEYEEAAGEYETELAKIDAFLSAAEEEGIDIEAVSETIESEEPDEEVIAEFEALAAGVSAVAEITDEDGNVEEEIAVALNDFTAALAAEEPDPADFGIWIPGIPALIEKLLEAMGTAEWLNSLIIDGIVGGVGAVLGFVPQMLVLFLLLTFLEGCGYMARVAFIMDIIFRKFGLSGKSFIPMLVGTGCGVPGVMASRTIESDRDRKMTIMTTTFIPCGAKLPIIALIAGALFGGAWWVAPSAYFVGVLAIIFSGVVLKKTKMFAGDPAPFVIELPAYRMPTVGNVLRGMWERGWSFIKKAGTIILLSCIVLWFLQGFGFEEGSFGMVEDLNNSILAKIGMVIAPLFTPLGWGDWKAAVAAITGLIAKENVVGTFGVLYGFAEVAEDGAEIWGTLASSFTMLSAYSFLVFNLLCAPCFAAIGAIRREMNSAKWTWFAIGYQTIFAYCVSLCIYRIGGLFCGVSFSVWTVVAVVLVIIALWLLLRPYKKSDKLTVGNIAIED